MDVCLKSNTVQRALLKANLYYSRAETTETHTIINIGLHSDLQHTACMYLYTSSDVIHTNNNELNTSSD